MTNPIAAGATALLAINGGPRVRSTPMPARHALGPKEEAMIAEAVGYYRARGLDPGYDGVFEDRYRRQIAEFMGGGYADAVTSGTAAIYIALMVLNLAPGSEVLVSPITDAGSVSPIILAGLTPKLMDSRPDHFNVDAEQVFRRVSDRTRAILIVHATGQPVDDIEEIVREAHRRGIRVVEDASQAIGATIDGRVVGSFGDINAWSTGSRKAQISGGNGGVVFTRDHELMRRVVAVADRGKPKLDPEYRERDPGTYVLPGLNLNAEEIGCAIGIASLGRLRETMWRRSAFVRALDDKLGAAAGPCRPYGHADGASPFFHPVIVDIRHLTVDKIPFALAVQAEGIDLNPDFRFLASDWPWLKPYLADGFDPPNARSIRDRSFNVFVNENYTLREADDAAAAIAKVSDAYSKA